MTARYGKMTAILFLAAVLLAAPALQARDYAFIKGTITAEPNTYNPDMGQWRYCIEFEWETGSRHAMSHVNLLMGLGGCTCADIRDALHWVEGADVLRERPGCGGVEAKFECNGDPSLDIRDPLYKFDFKDERGCDPDPSGNVRVWFLADQPPAPITTPNAFLVGKYAGETITGEVTGVFPGLACNPVGNRSMTWSRVKVGYLP